MDGIRSENRHQDPALTVRLGFAALHANEELKKGPAVGASVNHQDIMIHGGLANPSQEWSLPAGTGPVKLKKVDGAAVAPTEYEEMEVQIPAGKVPGQQFKVQTPAGVTSVTVPAGMEAGQALGIQVPVPTVSYEAKDDRDDDDDDEDAYTGSCPLLFKPQDDREDQQAEADGWSRYYADYWQPANKTEKWACIIWVVGLWLFFLLPINLHLYCKHPNRPKIRRYAKWSFIWFCVCLFGVVVVVPYCVVHYSTPRSGRNSGPGADARIGGV